MSTRTLNYGLALVVGALLALMIACNSRLASYTTPVVASWVAHGIGSVTAFFLLLISSGLSVKKNRVKNVDKSPLWSYLGGIPGAITVILAALTVNSTLGLSGSLALMLVGKIIFGLVCDTFGWFGVPKTALSLHNVSIVLLIAFGSSLIIFFRPMSG